MKDNIKFKEGIEPALKYLEDYIVTYKNQKGYKKYDEFTWINDILYGLGVSMDSDKYKWADGFYLFKKDLMEFLRENR